MSHRIESPYHIRLLGILEARRNGELLSKTYRKSTKSHKALARLILARGQSVSDNELIKAVGIDPEKNAETSLKVLIHRIRAAMPAAQSERGSCIIRTPGGYAWNMEFDATVDLFEAESLCERVITSKNLSSIEQDDISALAELFADNLLLEMQDEPWVELAQFRLEMQYTAAMSRVLTLMWNENAINRIIFTCLLGLSTNSLEPIFRDNLRRARGVADHLVDTEPLDMPDTRRKGVGLLDSFIEDIVLHLNSAAQTEREGIRQRQRDGIAEAMQRGVRFGRPLVAFGCNRKNSVSNSLH